MLPLNQVLVGNCLTVMREFPKESIDFVMFSPPYYGLRNYGEATETVWGGEENCSHEWTKNFRKHPMDRNGMYGEKQATNRGTVVSEPVKEGFCVKCGAWRGQFGLEPSWQMYVEHMVEICREVKRVLKASGSMYIVLGDTYFGGRGYNDYREKRNFRTKIDYEFRRFLNQKDSVYQPKCLMGIPWRVAFALIDDGWLLRNAIVWHKPNAMPSSVKDRLSNTYEHIFFFVKSRRYYYNLHAIRLPHKEESIERYQRALEFGGMYAKGSKPDMARQIGLGYPRQPPKSITQTVDCFRVPRQSKFLISDVKTQSPAARALKTLQSGKLTTKVKKKILDVGAYLKKKRLEAGISFEDLAQLTGIRQTTIEHYFRTDFSGQALPDRETWNTLKPILHLGEYKDFITEEIRNALPQPHPLGRNPGDFWNVNTEPMRGCWCPSCKTFVQHKDMKCPICNTHVVAHFATYPEKICVRAIKSSCPPDGIVLDPMCGSGTTLVAAKKLGRNYIGIDINPHYCDMARKRLSEIPENLTKWIGVADVTN